MRLLFLGKRHPQQRDLLESPYGRYFHLPSGLAARGHEVHVALLSHRGMPSISREHAGVSWFTGDLARPFEYRSAVLDRIRALRPDWVIGGSDLYFGILAARWGGRSGARVAIDAYDNFESYLPHAWPLHRAWHRALGQAQLLTAPGPQLLEVMRRHAPAAQAAIVPMAADPEFRPADRSAARRTLGLPPDARLVGYCGSLFRGRDAETFLAAAPRLRGASAVASGRLELPLPAAVRHLGYLAHDAVPSFLSALDVACITAAPNAFGSYAYPAKLYEALACGVPVVATDVAPIRWILGGDARLLVAPGDADALVARIEAQLETPHLMPNPGGWADSVLRLEAALR